jgi:phosphate uptake regulator
MERKVIKQGHNTLTITLPRSWCDKFNIKEGNKISVEEQEGSFNLLIAPSKKEELKKVEIDIAGLDFASIRHTMRSVYKLGYDEILLKFDNSDIIELKTGKPSTVMSVINHEVGMLLGCEIVEQRKHSVLIKDFTFASLEEFDNILKKVFLLLSTYSKDLVEGAKVMDKTFLKSMDEKHYNITKFIFFCLRILNKKGYKDFSKTPIIYYLISVLDDILDINKYVARDLTFFKQKKLKKETIEILNMVFDQIHNFYEYFYKPSKEKLLYFAENRWKIINKIKNLAEILPGNELLIVTNMEHCLELLLHLFEARMSLEY